MEKVFCSERLKQTLSMDELGEFIPSEKVKQLVPAVDPSSPISSYPLFVAQVCTYFLL